MKNFSSKIIDVLLWCFVAFCLLMAIGMGFGSGCVMMLITAVFAMPIKPIRNVWNKILGIQEIVPTDESQAKWWELKKKNQQHQYKLKQEDQKSRKMLKPLTIGIVFIISFCLGIGQMESTEPSDDYTLDTEIAVNTFLDEAKEEYSTTSESETAPISKTEAPVKTEVPTKTETPVETEAPTNTEGPTKTPSPTEETKQPELSNPTSTEFDLYSIPAYSGSPYVVVNNNNPYFSESDLTTTSFEYYSDLDSLGRCGVTYASVGIDLMPTEERGSIGSVKPTGWQTVKYDIVDGKYLYNRCHLIGYQLSGENANTKNLITGTRYLNIDGMLPFENMVADYIKETENHVMYRVTPIFEGNNLLSTGVLMEGYSVEDNGDGICFNIFCYNVQPGISIDYSDGSNSLDVGANESTPVTTSEPNINNSDNTGGTSSGTNYILNTNTKKFHKPSCSSVEQMKESNKQEYTGSREDVINQGYEPCKRCNP